MLRTNTPCNGEGEVAQEGRKALAGSTAATF